MFRRRLDHCSLDVVNKGRTFTRTNAHCTAARRPNVLRIMRRVNFIGVRSVTAMTVEHTWDGHLIVRRARDKNGSGVRNGLQGPLNPQTTQCSIGVPCFSRCCGISRMSVPMGSPRMPRVQGERLEFTAGAVWGLGPCRQRDPEWQPNCRWCTGARDLRRGR
jgi:hypothetical protein